MVNGNGLEGTKEFGWPGEEESGPNLSMEDGEAWDGECGPNLGEIVGSSTRDVVE